MITLFEAPHHRNVMFHDMSSGQMVQANQHVIVDHGESMLLDPGGHKVYSRLFGEMSKAAPPAGLKHLFFSHQDPDIVAAANGWFMVTEARGYISELWTRFVPHFGLDDLVAARLQAIPDPGMTLKVGQCELLILPAHFLHSSGNFHVYDPVAKTLYSGDLGTSIGQDYTEVGNFDEHVRFMEGFHRRYMPTSKALKRWVTMARKLDIEILAPQHGAVFKGKERVNRFLEWADNLPCGLDLMPDDVALPR
ncbi:MAG: MBL fold metallo-hydrolase [Deltaproteobacteria bacterium]|nr:MBL fold metallo-hydrolase [Deltaproteobacteria bacterium]